MRTTDEITHNGKTLTEILRLHKMWARCESGGQRADLSDTNLRGSDLSVCNLSEADLRGANLSEADLSGANLSGANLSWADLSVCNLSVCNLSGANLSEADLRGSDLSVCNLRGCNLSEADLSGCDLSRCDLSGCNLSEADLSGAKFIYRGVEAKRFQVFNNLYKYCVYAILSTDGAQYVRLGCKFYSREDWMDGKGNNPDEFPDDGSEGSELRKFALSTAFAWLDLIVKQEEKKEAK